MINKVKFLRNPGYMCDLIFIFLYNFNRQYCLNKYINLDKSKTDTEYFHGVMYEFLKISDKLLLFFNMDNRGKCFFTEYYFEPYQNILTSEYNLFFIQRQINDMKKITKNIFKYYFPDIAEEMRDSYLDSPMEILKSISDLKYDDKIKNLLYVFFINPDSIIQKLNNELLSANLLLEKYYDRNIIKVENIQNNINLIELFEMINQYKNNDWLVDMTEDLTISVCLLNKNYIIDNFDNKAIILGHDYKNMFSYLLSPKIEDDLSEIFSAFAIKNRITILDFIHEKGEISINEIANELKFSSATINYHLTLMHKAKIINKKYQGKKIIYSINKKRFKDLENYFTQKFSIPEVSLF